MFFAAVNSMYIDHYREGLRSDEAQDCSVQTQEENTPKHNVLVYFEGCSEERIAVVSNATRRDHP